MRVSRRVSPPPVGPTCFFASAALAPHAGWLSLLALRATLLLFSFRLLNQVLVFLTFSSGLFPVARNMKSIGPKSAKTTI